MPPRQKKSKAQKREEIARALAAQAQLDNGVGLGPESSGATTPIQAPSKPTPAKVPPKPAPKPVRSNGPAKPHKRGGTHQLKAEERTGTKWDDCSHQELVDELRTRPAIWKKDLKKVEMIRRLANDDRERAKERRHQRIAQENAAKAARKKREDEEKAKAQREQELRDQHEARKAEREKRKRDDEEKTRQQRRERGEKSDAEDEKEKDTDSEEVEEPYYLDYPDHVSEKTESIISESTNTITTKSPLFPESRLQIFEWHDHDILSPRKASDRYRENPDEGDYAKKIPYVVMDLVTTLSGEKMELPGHKNPDSIGADYVPKLTQYVMNCTRNGVMVGTLRKAIIESGAEWAKRTDVHWWNGRMYFKLPPRTSEEPLQKVYDRFRQAKPRMKDPKTGETIRYTWLTPEEKQERHLKKKKARLMQVFASSEYRPPIGFAPVELEYPNLHDAKEDGRKRLRDLYYVRFPGNDLPHFCFWVRKGEWEDPLTPNPEWAVAKSWDEKEVEKQRNPQPLREFDEENPLFVKDETEEDLERPFALDYSRTRVKIPGLFLQNRKRLPKTSRFETVLESVEKHLYSKGLASTLFKYRDEWRDDGKDGHWDYLSDMMPQLYPSGQLPDRPPVHQDRVPKTSLAEKIASIDVPAPERPVSPIRGDEPWTRNDDAYWNVVDLPDEVAEVDIQEELLDTTSELLRDAESPVLGLPGKGYKRLLDNTKTEKRVKELDAWLQNISPSNAPLSAKLLASPVGKSLRDMERENWESLFERAATGRRTLRSASSPTELSMPNLVSHLESIPVAELKWQLYSHLDGHLNRGETQCRVCLQELDNRDVEGVRAHYLRHHEESDKKCPFCGMRWGLLDSEAQASHIYAHDFDDALQRRKSSIPMLYSIPDATRASSSKSSRSRPPKINTKDTSTMRVAKVHFSPRTVERRIPYNDYDQPILPPIPSPKKSNLKRPHRSTPNLKLDTASNARKNKIKNRKQTPVAPHSWEVDTPETDSDHVSSPELENGKRKRLEDDDAAWDFSTYSTIGENHVDSLCLPPVKRSKSDHSDGGFDASSGDESLEYDIAPKGGKGNTGKSVSFSRIGKRKAKAIDPTYRDEEPSSAGSSAHSPVFRKPWKPADGTYRYETPSEPSSPDSKRKTPRKKTPKTTRKTGQMEADALSFLTPLVTRNDSEDGSMSGKKRPRTTPHSSPVQKKRKL